MTIEMWRPILGYERLYEVSNYGSVRSFDRICIQNSRWGLLRRVWKGRAMKLQICCLKDGGYWKVSLCKDGIPTDHMIHRLVATAFAANPEGKPVVNHKDGNKRNNRWDNLEWATWAEDRKHCYAIGLRPVGKENHFAKLPRNEKGYCVKGYKTRMGELKRRQCQELYGITVTVV